MSRRALRNLALALLAETDEDDVAALVAEHYQAADNLTDRRAALAAAVGSERLRGVAGTLLEDFLERFKSEALVVNQWFAVQAGSRLCSADDVRQLAAHGMFDINNPNKIRSLYGAFMQTNLRNFHAADGSGYELIAEIVLQLNALNPQMASALAKPLGRWRRISGPRSASMRRALETIAGSDELSPDVFEVVTKSLAD